MSPYLLEIDIEKLMNEISKIYLEIIKEMVRD